MKKKKKDPRKGSDIMRELIEDLRESAYVKDMFNTKSKREFIGPFFGFVLPLMLSVVNDLGTEDAFEFLFSEHFKAMCIAALMKIKNHELAETEVKKLAKDMKLKLPKEEDA